MANFIAWAISALVGATLLTFVVYLRGLLALPTGHRPRTPMYDRLGREVNETENPDFHVNPGAKEQAGPTPERTE